jgi:diguanylate cyclase (GGDEF)-like protein/PAS domain S-box-containing protein
MNLSTFQFHSLKARTTLFTMGIFVLSIWTLAYYAGHILRHEFEITHSQYQFSTVSVLADQINLELNLRLRSLETVSESITPAQLKDPQQLQLLMEKRPVFQSLFNGGTFITRSDGVAIASVPVSLERVGVNYMDRDHVVSALKYGKSTVSRPVIGRKIHSTVVSIAAPIRDIRGNNVGVLIGVTDLGKPNFLNNVTDNRYGKSGDYLITSKQYRMIVTASDKSRVFEVLPTPGSNPTLDRFVNGYEGSEIFINPHGVEVLASAKSIPVANWYLAASESTKDVFAPITLMQQQILFAALFLSLLAAGLTWWMLRRQLSPLFNTVQLLARLASAKETPKALPVTRQDEIGELISSFNLLLATLTHRDEHIYTLTNMYAALTHCNQAIVRCKNEQELFSEICRDVVQFGGMKMAWIGMLDQASRKVIPVASFGEGIAYLDGIEISLDAHQKAGQGPTGTSMREDRPYWCQDFQHDPATSLWHDWGAKFDWNSSASIPLRCNGKVVGAFSFYSSKVNAFDEDMQGLIRELAQDLSFALDNFDRENKRKRVEAALIERDEVLKESQIIAGLGSYVMDFQSGLWERSEVLNQLFGIDAAYASTLYEWEQLIHPDDRQMMSDYLHQELAKHSASFNKEYRIIRLSDQTLHWVHGLGKLEYDGQGSPLRMKGTIQEITARREAEALLIKLSQAVEQSPNSIFITDLNANIEYANAAFTKITGYRLEQIIGKNPRLLQSGKTTRATYEDMWAHLRRGEVWRGELFNRRKDGSDYVETALISPVRQANGQITHYLAIKEDTTEKRAAEQRIDRLAHFDQLTGLPNNTLLQDHFKFALSLAQRRGENLSIMFIDLDHFKDINDTLGHSVGDQLLMEMALRIKASLREEDTVSRKGGDEFVLILPGTDADGAALVASKLMTEISRPGKYAQHELITTASIGIAIYPHDGNNLEILSKNADAAMYRVKQESRNDFRFFTPEMQKNSARILQLNHALHFALSRNEFVLHFQPQISIADGSVIGAEALLRWNHPELGSISPAEFIPVAEDNGQIIPIGEWVLRTATHQLKAWLDCGLPPLVMAVNLSAIQFRQANIAKVITSILDEVKLPHHYLEVELTEAVAMGKPLEAIAIMETLHNSGILMSIDDFGTGYSSLSYLKKFKINKLKIDQSFVRNITDDSEDKAIVSTIINLASSLGLRTIAEGVETAGQLAYLRLQGCDEVQGYYFSKPLPAEQFEIFLRKQ